MKTLRRVFAAAVVLGLAVVVYAFLDHSDPGEGSAPDLAGAPASADVLARGEYLTRAADCAACHTVPGGKAFAGGYAFKLPFGTIYSSNITGDGETGIGGWSDDEFVRALREGIRKDGQHLYPAYPYTSYTALSRRDALAIKAYLLSVPAVHAPPPANDLAFPFNQRWAMAFWNAVFFKSQRFQTEAAQSAQWNRGAYLATALGHCGECHTPRNLAFAVEKNQQFAGSELDGWRVWNITSDAKAGIGGWSDEQLASYLNNGHAQGHGPASGPMGEAVENSLQYLNQDDTAALIAYLRSVSARSTGHDVVVNPQPAPVLQSSASAPPESEADGMGRKVFEGECASCHQWNGAGQQSPVAGLLGARSVNDPTGLNVMQIILKGSAAQFHGFAEHMPEFGSAHSDTEIAALTNYVIQHFGNQTASVTADDVRKARQQ